MNLCCGRPLAGFGESTFLACLVLMTHAKATKQAGPLSSSSPMEVIKVAKVDRVGLTQLSHQSSNRGAGRRDIQQVGSLLITPHHLIWSPLRLETSAIKKTAGDVWIPHSSLTAVQHLPRLRQPTLLIRLATFVFYTLSFNSPNELDDVWDSLKALISSRKPGEKESLYAFVQGAASPSKRLPPSDSSSPSLPGWDVYDPRSEFARMKVIGHSPSKDSANSAWRLTSINSNFNFCSTYPSLLLIPSKISDTTLTYAVKYRSKGRLPIGTYVHWANGSSITRSSQPMVGFKNARSIQDEKLIEAIFHSHALHTGPVAIGDQATQQVVYGATSSNLIIDARPTTNAMANTVKGAGTENMEYYKGCRKAYLGIDNIHVMRDSLNKVVTAIHESFVTETPVSLDMLKRSGWLKHIGAILEGTSLITRTVHVYNSHVLIHCSDGWDRTSQLSALSQVCLDPYYRTFKGFAVLIEKDWLSFGHKFSDRSGIVISGRERVNFGDSPNHSNYATNLTREECEESSSASGAWVTSIQKQLNFGNSVGSSHAYKETSPVFHQFLDCVYQLQRQYPRRFEFNSRFLERLHEELHTGNHGTFLFDCEKERQEANAAQLTCSVWELLLPPNDISEYQNTQYNPSLDDPTDRLNTDQGVLYPDVQDIVFWWELFGCPNEEMNPPRALDPTPSSEFTHIESIFSQSDEITSSIENMDKLTFDQFGNSKKPTASSSVLQGGSPSTQPRDMSGASSVPNDFKRGHFQTSGQSESSYSSPANQGDPLQTAFQQAKIMGWSTWDRLKKGYEDVARGSSISSHPSSPRVYQHTHSLSGGSPSHHNPATRSAIDTSFSPPDQQRCLLSAEPNPWSDPRPESSTHISPTPSPRMQKKPPSSPPLDDPWQLASSTENVTSKPQAIKPQSRSNTPATVDQINHLPESAEKDFVDQPFPSSSPASHPTPDSKLGCRPGQADIDPLGVGLT